MKLTSYAGSLHELNILKDLGFEEVILGPKELNRFGKLSESEFIALAKRAKELKLRVLLEWDILMTEDVFNSKIPFINTLLPFTDALRLQDPGALHWAIENTQLPVQFIAENGNHNLMALEGWIELAQNRLERVILSIELSKDTIAAYVKKIKVDCELLGFGRILLFYTPRPLLSALTPEKIVQNEEIAALGESEESPHKGFPLIENQHGTFMFHIKEFCLLDFAKDLKDLGLSYFRIDQRFETPSRLTEIVSLAKDFTLEKFDSFKGIYSQDLMRGFYLVNKTDILFPKLKNSRLQKREGDYVGEILDAEKGSHLAIMVKNPKGLKSTDILRIVHPKLDEFILKIYSLKNLALEDVSEVPVGDVAVIQYMEGIWTKSQVFYHH